MRQGRGKRIGAIRTETANEQISKTPGRAIALRLVALVLAWALLLLPAGVGQLPVPAGDLHAKQTVVRDGSAGLVLSNYDRSQSAIRNSETKNSGKSAGTGGKAVFAQSFRLAEPVLRRLDTPRPSDTAFEPQQFQAFSARAPPSRA